MNLQFDLISQADSIIPSDGNDPHISVSRAHAHNSMVDVWVVAFALLPIALTLSIMSFYTMSTYGHLGTWG